MEADLIECSCCLELFESCQLRKLSCDHVNCLDCLERLSFTFGSRITCMKCDVVTILSKKGYEELPLVEIKKETAILIKPKWNYFIEEKHFQTIQAFQMTKKKSIFSPVCMTTGYYNFVYVCFLNVSRIDVYEPLRMEFEHSIELGTICPRFIHFESTNSRLYMIDKHSNVRACNLSLGPIDGYEFSIGTGLLQSPQSLTITQSGRIYIVDAVTAKVHVFKIENNEYFGEFATELQLKRPTGICHNLKNQILIADADLSKIFIVNEDGQFINSISIEVKSRDLTCQQTFLSIYVDKYDYIIVTDKSHACIHIFNDEGEFVSRIDFKPEKCQNQKQ